MMIVHIDKPRPAYTKNEFSAMPVMIPGSASGRIRRNDTDSRPKKRKRAIANAAIEPSTQANPVVIAPTLSDSSSAERASWSCHVTLNQWNVQPGIGQLSMFELLKA